MMITFLQQQSQLVLRCKYGFTNHRRFFLASTSSCHADCKKQLPYDCYTSNYSYYYSSYKHIRTANNIISSANSINQYCNANKQLRWFSSTIGYHGTHHGGRGRGRGNNRLPHRSNTNRIPMMKEFNTLDDAIEVYYNNLEILTPRNLSAFWSAVPRLLRYQERGVTLVPQLQAIFLKTADQIHNYGPIDLATTTLGFAKTIQTLQRSKRGYVKGSYEDYLHGILIRQRDAVFSFLARTVVPKLHQFEPRYLKDLAYTYALLEYVPKQLDDGSTLFNHIAEKSIPKLEKFNPQELANTVWAFEKIKVSHPDLFKRIGEHIVGRRHLNDFTTQNLSNIVLAYAKAGVTHPKLFYKVADHIVSLDHLNDFIPQNLSNIVWSYTKAGVSHQGLYERVGDHIIARHHLNDFIPQELSNIVYSYAKAEISHPELFNKVGDHIATLNHLNEFKPQELANSVWAYASARISHPELFNKVADHVVTFPNLDGYNEQETSNLVWAYHKAGVIRQDLNDKLISVAIDRKFGTKRLETLKRWASEEEDIQNQEDDEQAEDENGGVVAVEDDNNENNVEGEDDASVSEDLSLLTVVQLKDRLRHLGLPVSGRKHELISRLNDYFKVQDGDE